VIYFYFFILLPFPLHPELCLGVSAVCKAYQTLKLTDTKAPGFKHSESCMTVQARCNFKYLELTITLNAPGGQMANNLSMPLPLSLFSFFYLLQYVLSDHIVCPPSPWTQIRPNNPENLMNFSCACYTALCLTV